MKLTVYHGQILGGGGGGYSFIRFLLLRKSANPLALIDATVCQKELSDATVGNESLDVL